MKILTTTRRLAMALPFALISVLATDLAICADTPPAQEANDATIASVLQRGDTVIASTAKGLYEASAKEKSWQKMDTPPSMPSGGTLMQQAPDSPLLGYYQPVELLAYLFGGKVQPGDFYLSKDAGKTWTKTPAKNRFLTIFIHPDGDIFAVQPAESSQPPDDGGIFGTTDRQGRNIYRYSELVVSHDMGATWQETTTHFPSGYMDYSLLPDPDHPSQVCFTVNPSESDTHGVDDPRLSYVYQADDATYRWKKYDAATWHGGLLPMRDQWSFGGLYGGLVGIHGDYFLVPATLGNYFTLPFMKDGNGLAFAGTQLQTEKTTYTFRSGEPKIIPVKVILLGGTPAKITDDADETHFWGMDVLTIGQKPLYYPMPAQPVQPTAATQRKTVDFDSSHPFARTINLSKYHDFSKPGSYKIQLFRWVDDNLWQSPPIDITITP